MAISVAVCEIFRV